MKILYLPLLLLGVLSCTGTKNILPTDSDLAMTNNDNSDPLNYLALGDSYTIGEGVSDSGRYPSQLIKKLNAETDKIWADPKVIARTGWTVDELEKGINTEMIEGNTYDLVTLLIGVNNQYRGRSVKDFEVEFEAMLLRAIDFAGKDKNHVAVLSIPDWGITPFALVNNKDIDQVRKEINAYNLACKKISDKYKIAYIDITKEYRKVGDQVEMLADDGLHPSSNMYEIWTEKLYKQVKSVY